MLGLTFETGAKKILFLGVFCLSSVVVALGQPARSGFLGSIAAIFGFALLWKVMEGMPPRRRFYLGTVWFFFIQILQLSWMATPQYVGWSFLIVYGLLSLAMGAQFGLLCLWLSSQMTVLTIAAMAGSWVMLEWLRIFWLTGFPWNPIGLALTGNDLSLQMASIGGIYGLSFWVIWVNGLTLLVFQGRRSFKVLALWGMSCMAPYLWGALQLNVSHQTAASLRIALLDTALSVEQKYWTASTKEAFIPPLTQWALIWQSLLDLGSVDLVVLPEGAIALSAEHPYYSVRTLQRVWEELFDEPLPRDAIEVKAYLSNIDVATLTAQKFQTQLILGLDERAGDQKFNSAFSIGADQKIQTHRKQILVPVGEYIPLPNISRIGPFLQKTFGIADSFLAATSQSILQGPVPLGVCICLEELYGHLARDLKRQGAQLLVGLANDVWFPHSLLGRQHLFHARVRAVENGLPMIRSVNCGSNAIIDAHGRILSLQDQGGVLYGTVPLFSYSTLYSLYGVTPLLTVSVILMFLWLIFQWKKIARKTEGMLGWPVER